jgi:hypothetical protein
LATRPTRRDGLIGPFATREHCKPSTEQGLARSWKSPKPDYHVRIAAADHDDLSFFRHNYRLSAIGKGCCFLATRKPYFGTDT